MDQIQIDEGSWLNQKKLSEEEEKEELDKIKDEEIRAMLLAGISIDRIQEIVGQRNQKNVTDIAKKIAISDDIEELKDEDFQIGDMQIAVLEKS